MARPSQRVSFEGGAGTPLAARLDLPAGPPQAYALFAHCFTCSKDIFAAGRVAGELNAQGFAVLRFDFTGLGASDGDFANTDFSSNLEDLRRAVAWLRANASAPQLLVGHSLGGAAVLALANEFPEVRAVATIGAPADAEHLTRLFTDSVERITREGQAEVSIGGRPFTIRREFLDDLQRHPLAESTAALDAALLVLHSPTDNVVGVDNAARIYGAARHPKSFIALDGADHLLSRHADATFAALMIATWANRYIAAEHPLAPLPASTAPVVVAEAGQGTFLNQVVAGNHRFLADEPEAVGGFDAGASPYELLGAALGACTSMTMRMYADRKGIPLERATVEVLHSKVHVTDCEACVEGRATQVDRFERRIRLQGDLTDGQRDSLMAIADRCPVHRTLTGSSEIVTTGIPHDEAHRWE